MKSQDDVTEVSPHEVTMKSHDFGVLAKLRWPHASCGMRHQTAVPEPWRTARALALIPWRLPAALLLHARWPRRARAAGRWPRWRRAPGARRAMRVGEPENLRTVRVGARGGRRGAASTRLLRVLPAASCLLLAACGGDDDDVLALLRFHRVDL